MEPDEKLDSIIASVSVWIPAGGDASALAGLPIHKGVDGTVYKISRRSSRSSDSETRSDAVRDALAEASDLLEAAVAGGFKQWAGRVGARLSLYVTVSSGPQAGFFGLAGDEIDVLSRLGGSLSVDSM